MVGTVRLKIRKLRAVGSVGVRNVARPDYTSRLLKLKVLTNKLALKKLGGSLPPLHKPAIGSYLQQELSNL